MAGGRLGHRHGGALIATSCLVVGLLVPVASASGAIPVSASTRPVSQGCQQVGFTVTCSWIAPGTYTWTAPASLGLAQFDVSGAAGGFGDIDESGYGPGGGFGSGTEVIGDLTVVPGHKYQVNVGGSGALQGAGGFNGGGGVAVDSGAGSGGGASDVRTGTAATSRIVVGGGGGGGGGGGSWCVASGSSGCQSSGTPGGGAGGTGSTGVSAGGGCGPLDSRASGAGGGFVSRTGGPGGFGGGSAAGIAAGKTGGNGAAAVGGAGGATGQARNSGGGGGGGGGYGGGGGGGGGSDGTITISPTSFSTCTGPGGGGAAGASYADPSLIPAGHSASFVDGSTADGWVSVSYTALALGAASGRPGSVVAVSGDGFTPGERVTLALGAQFLTATTALGDGQIVAFPIIPATVKGASYIVATGASSGTTEPGAFTVTADLVALPATGAPGASATAGAFGLNASTPVTLHWDSVTGPLLGSATTDQFGSAAIPFTVPATAGLGAHDLIASYASASVTARYTVTSAAGPVLPAPTQQTAAVYPAAASPGSPVLVTAAGFAAGAAVPVSLGSSGATLAQPVAGQSGLVYATVIVPPAPAGPAAIVVGNSVLGARIGTVTVRPHLVVLPGSAPLGSTPTAAVFGFAIGDAVTVTTSAALGSATLHLTTDPSGSGSVGVPIPGTAPVGQQTLIAADAARRKVSATFTVTPAITTTEVTASPNQVTSGKTITFTATVIASPASAGVPTGTVSFADGPLIGTPMTIMGCGAVTLNASGQAKCKTTLVATVASIVGVTAAYGGSSRMAASRSDLLLVAVSP